MKKEKRVLPGCTSIAGIFLITKASDYYRHLNYERFLPVVPVYIAAFISILYGLFKRRIDSTGKYNQIIRFMQALTFAVLGVLLFLTEEP